MKHLLILVLLMTSGAGFADDRAVEAAVQRSFDDMPRVKRVNVISGLCGADRQTNSDVAFCTTTNTVYVRNGASHAGYKLAHVMGHAVQVRHGIADIALREIRARPSEERKLRGLVTRQVECIAGFLIARAGLPRLNLKAAFKQEPFTDSHWGRNPLRIGPQVSIGRDERTKWLGIGHAAKTLASCRVGEMGADLLLKAYKG